LDDLRDKILLDIQKMMIGITYPTFGASTGLVRDEVTDGCNLEELESEFFAELFSLFTPTNFKRFFELSLFGLVELGRSLKSSSSLSEPPRSAR
jgi:hypothetical protein